MLKTGRALAIILLNEKEGLAKCWAVTEAHILDIKKAA